jgi:AraC family transcriptional regulator of arabinose operon
MERVDLSASGDPRVRTVLRAVSAQPSLGVREAAAMVGLSMSRLQHLIHEEIGTSICAYKRECKLLYACNLLGNTTLLIKEIRYLCGIRDPSRFARVFKKRFGLPPSAFRTTIINGSNGVTT